MEKLGFIHQKCIFHLKLNINEKVKRYLNKIKQKYARKYKKQHPNASEYKVEKYSEIEIKEEKSEITRYKNLFFELS